MLHTDEASVYHGLPGFDHQAVNHKNREFVRDDVATNGAESIFAVMKRGITVSIITSAENTLDDMLTSSCSVSTTATSIVTF
jgi:hypothetical protein